MIANRAATLVPARAVVWLLGLLLGVGALAQVDSTEGIRWDGATRRLSAAVEDWPLDRLLEHLAAATRWRILVEPGLERRVTTRFRSASLGEALKRFLGRLSYAYVPGPAGRAKLLVFSSSMDAATSLVAAPPADKEHAQPKRIPDEIILRVPADSDVDIEALAKRLGAEIVGKLPEQGAYRLKFKNAEAAEAARKQLKQEGAFGAEDNYLIELPGRPDTLASLPMPSLALRPRAPKNGEEVIVAVIDTPVQTEGTVLKDFLLPGISVAGPADVPPNTLSHGTSMAETILNGVAEIPASADGTPVRLLPVDVYGNHESSSSFAVAQGIQAAISAGADIVNLSLGGDGGSPLVHELIRAGSAQGVVFLGAAGNEPVDTPTYPAAFPEVIAVTALTPGGEPAPYANRGDFIDVGAPGLSIVPFWGKPYYVVGTSTATARVSAQAANLILTRGLRGPDLESALRAGLLP